MTHDNRKHCRHLCVEGGVLRLAVRPEFRGRRAVLVDVSAGGIGFLLPDPLAAGATLVFEVKGTSGAETIARIARVRHCRPHPVPPDAPWFPKPVGISKIFRLMFGVKSPPSEGNAWLVGCEFDRPLSEDEVTRFVASLKVNGGDAYA